MEEKFEVNFSSLFTDRHFSDETMVPLYIKKKINSKCDFSELVSKLDFLAKDKEEEIKVELDVRGKSIQVDNYVFSLLKV